MFLAEAEPKYVNSLPTCTSLEWEIYAKKIDSKKVVEAIYSRFASNYTHRTIFVMKTSNYFPIIVYFNDYNIFWLHVQLS